MAEHDEQPPEAPHLHPRRIAPPHRPEGPEPPGQRALPPLQRRDAALPAHRGEGVAAPTERRSPRMPHEVVQGKQTKSRYIRVLTTAPRRGFRRRRGGILEATEQVSRPQSGRAALAGRIKAALVGAPLSTARLAHERLSKTKALAVFSSDALSSSAYATEEILIVLALAGTGHLGLSVPIAIAIVALLGIVSISYRQTIFAYPNGGGAYIVARANLGETPGLVAAGSLLVDYILTVSVSVAAGVSAIIAALPALASWRVEMGVTAIIIVTVLNLRGVSEAGTIFAIPTYAFILTGGAVLVVGAIRVVTGTADPVVYQDAAHGATQGLTLFLILRAFSSGCAALTGVEAISNGVPAFKSPESKNAAATLTWMALILGTLFMGITLLARKFGLQEVEGQTIVAQLGRAVFGGENVFFYTWQAVTALILLLAANTCYADFPRLASLLAKDNYMPRQFTFRGDRLAFSNGIIVLAVAAALILIGFGGDVTRLIPLYAIGVFTSFTLSQLGMVKHWLAGRGAGWRRSLVINGTGAAATAVVAAVIIVTKFTHGAWMSMLLVLILFLFFRAIHRHYAGVDAEMALPDLDEPLPVVSRPQVVVVPVRSLNKPVVQALAYARSIATNVTAVHITDEPREAERLQERWERWAGDVPLVIIESPYRSFTQPLLSYLDMIEEADPEMMMTVVLTEFVPRHWWQSLLHNQDALRLKAALFFRPGTVVIDVPQHPAGAPPPSPAVVGGDGVS